MGVPGSSRWSGCCRRMGARRSAGLSFCSWPARCNIGWTPRAWFWYP